jgi:hypothetical protein
MVLTNHIGNFLPDLVICIHGACDSSLDVSQLLNPLASVCALLGTPVSETALGNAEQQASSLAAQVTVTQTVIYTSGSVAPSPVGPAAASTTTGGVIVQTIPTTNSAGSTYTTTQTSSQFSSPPSSSVSSTTTATRIGAQSTTGAFATSTTSAASNSDSTDSSPFDYQSVAGQDRVGSLLGMAILFVVIGFWL